MLLHIEQLGLQSILLSLLVRRQISVALELQRAGLTSDLWLLFDSCYGCSCSWGYLLSD